MSVLMKDALAAKAAMKDELTRLGIRAACGVTSCESGLAVKVNLPDANNATLLPSAIKGVPVIIEISGAVRALAASAVR